MKENLHTEFKSSFNDAVIETLVAFANSSGGSVIIGVNDKGVNNVVDNVVNNVVDNENGLIALIKEDPFITAKQLASKMKTTERTVQRYLQKAQQKGLLTRIGPHRGGHWKIASSGKRK